MRLMRLAERPHHLKLTVPHQRRRCGQSDPDDRAGHGQHRADPGPAARRCRLLLADNLQRAGASPTARHRVLCGDRTCAPRRAAAGGPARPNPRLRDRQTAHGPQTQHPQRPNGFSTPQGDRRTGVRLEALARTFVPSRATPAQPHCQTWFGSLRKSGGTSASPRPRLTGPVGAVPIVSGLAPAILTTPEGGRSCYASDSGHRQAADRVRSQIDALVTYDDRMASAVRDAVLMLAQFAEDPVRGRYVRLVLRAEATGFESPCRPAGSAAPPPLLNRPGR